MSKTETPDIVERLQTAIDDRGKGSVWGYAGLLEDAAAEIERLRSELADYEQAASVEADLRREFKARAEKAEAELAKHQWRVVYDEAEDTYYAPADTKILLGWWQEWPEREWVQEAGVHRSTKGGWLHSQATHWQPLPSSPGENDGGSTTNHGDDL